MSETSYKILEDVSLINKVMSTKPNTKPIPSELEEFFDIEFGSTPLQVVEVKRELTDCDLYDDKDKEIEESLQEISDLALTEYKTILHQTDTIDVISCPKQIKARAELLKISLSASEKRMQLKQKKDGDKLKSDTGGARGVVNNNVIIANTADLIREFSKKINDSKSTEENIVEGEYTDMASEKVLEKNDE